MNQKGFSTISLLLVSLILIFGIAILSRNNFLSNLQTTIVSKPTPLTTFTPNPSLAGTEKPTAAPTTSNKWVWEILGCGSSVPCSYRVYSTTNPNTYICGGYYDKTSPEGEKQPSQNEDPRTTTNFKCTKIK